MGFKRPDDATPSYEKVRGRLSPAGKFTNDPVGKNWRPKQDAAPDPEHNEAAPPSDAVAPAVDPPSRVPEPSPAPEPTPPPLAAVAPSPAVQAEAAPKKALPKPASTEKSSGEAFAQSPSVKSEAVTLKGWVPYPASGQNPVYDRAVAAYGEKRALQLILHAAVTAYREAVLSGEVDKPLVEHEQSAGGGLKTGRTVDAAFFAKAKALLDPMGLMTNGKLAGTIFRQALSYKSGVPD